MRIGTLVAGVLVMAAGFGLAALVIGWPALLVGGPVVFGGLVVVLVTYLTAVQQQHAREYRYAQVAQQQWAAAVPAWDGSAGTSYVDRPAWSEYRPLQDEDTLDSEELAELIAGLPTGIDESSPDDDSRSNGSELTSDGSSGGAD